MHQKFNDPMKAACYIGMGLGNDVPNDAVVEVTFRAGPKIHTQVCPIAGVVRVMEPDCRKFPRASVHYYPDDRKGVLAELFCHCEEDMKRRCCDHSEGRPRIVVKLSDAAFTPTACLSEAAKD